MSDGRPRLAVLRALGLGDLLTAVPALRALARAFPDHQRLLLAPAWLEPLLPLIREDGEPCLSGMVEVGGLDADPWTLPRHAEVVVNLHGRGPQSHRLLLAAEPLRLIAFQHDAIPRTVRMPRWEQEEHEAQRWCRLLRENEIEADPEHLGIDPPDLELPEWLDGATLLHPAAASAARRWPVERWAEVARGEVAAGRRVIVTGSAKEVGLARSIAAAAGLHPRQQLAGRTDLRSLAALVARAGTVICGDTGVAHLATALSTPSLLLFGPTSPAHWGPPPQRSIHRVLWEGRTGNPHGAEPDPGLLGIEVNAVLEALAASRSVAVA
jgi:ADP-heptose:LPS heptosyltransferase